MIATKHTIIIILLIITALIGMFFVIYAVMNDKIIVSNNFSIGKNPEEQLENRYREHLDDEASGDYKKMFEFFSPESTLDMNKDAYVQNEKSNSEDYYREVILEIHNVIVKDNVGYIEVSGKDCYSDDDECHHYRKYEKFILINSEWYLLWDHDNGYCIKDEEDAMGMPDEFERALSLIMQRYERARGYVGLGGLTSHAYYAHYLQGIRNCLQIEYALGSDDIGDAGGIFEYTLTKALNEYVIKVNIDYMHKDDLLTAVLLSHELKHIEQRTLFGDVKDPDDCYAREGDALLEEWTFMTDVLNEEEQRSLESRISQSPDVARLYRQFDEVANADGVSYKEKARNYVKSIPAYQEQCGQY